MTISINLEKALDKIHYLLMIKTLNHLGREANCLKRCLLYKETIVNITPAGEMLKAFPLIPRQGCPLSTLLFDTVLHVLASTISK